MSNGADKDFSSLKDKTRGEVSSQHQRGKNSNIISSDQALELKLKLGSEQAASSGKKTLALRSAFSKKLEEVKQIRAELAASNNRNKALGDAYAKKCHEIKQLSTKQKCLIRSVEDLHLELLNARKLNEDVNLALSNKEKESDDRSINIESLLKRIEAVEWRMAESELIECKLLDAETRLHQSDNLNEEGTAKISIMEREISRLNEQISLILVAAHSSGKARLFRISAKRQLFKVISVVDSKLPSWLKFVERLESFSSLRLVRSSFLFDHDWYLKQRPDVRESGIDPCEQYVRRGAAQGHQPGPFFDGNWYLNTHIDVARARINPLVHYLRHGIQEGRSTRTIFQTPSRAITAKPPRLPGVSQSFGVNFFGPVTIASGLGTASRGYLGALARAQVPVSVTPVLEGFQHQTQVRCDFPNRARRTFGISLVHLNADTTPTAIRLFPREFSEHRYRIGLWVWELPAFPPKWQKHIRQFDEIWVPSRFCQRAVAAVSNRPVVLMPYVVPVSDAPQDRSMRHTLRLDASTFVFLYIFDASSYTARKNPECLVDAFVKEFGDNPNMSLVLKVCYQNIPSNAMEQLKDICKDRPNIIWIEEVMNSDDVTRLIDSADCYVSPHRSEGFGLTIAEAMARARPVIATNYSGSTDFLSESNGYPLPYKLRELSCDIGPYQRGYVWADPDTTALQGLMRQVLEDSKVARDKATQARATIELHFSQAAIAERIRGRLDQIWKGVQRDSPLELR